MAKEQFGHLNVDRSGQSENILQLEEQTRVQILEPAVETWLQHGIKSQKDGDNSFRSVPCPQDSTCPLCAKGRKHFPISKRYAVNVWDYKAEAIKILIGGKSIFVQGFERDAKVGFDITKYDYMINKTGKGLNTEYDVVRLEMQDRPEVEPSDLHDLSSLSEPLEPEKVFELLDEFGIEYDELEVPEFTFKEACEYKMPFGKYKDWKVGELVTEDADYASYICSVKQEAGDIADPTYVALNTVLEGELSDEGWSEVEEEEEDEEEVEEEHRCPVCKDFVAKTATGLKVHMNAKHGDAKKVEKKGKKQQGKKAEKKQEQQEEVDRDLIVSEIKRVFLEDDRFNDFSKISKTIQEINPKAEGLNDLSDQELVQLRETVA